MAGSESAGKKERSSSVAVDQRVRIRVHGIVQGVGFRPFIFQLANNLHLAGWVRNQSDGVEIEVAGRKAEIGSFIQDIGAKAPPLARVINVEVSEEPFSPMTGFHILESRYGQSRRTLISPDVCTCGDCLGELFDPRNRRYLYPFINCTNCGPRYTIIKDVPYDRDKTTMSGFAMCPACRAEYDDPLDRRFHAQPNACWECGPQVWLESAAGGEWISRGRESIREAAHQIGEGKIVAVKGLGGFHLAADAVNGAAVDRLRSRKIREEKPFAVLFKDLEAVRSYCKVSEEEASLLLSPQRPIVLLERCPGPSDRPLAHSVAPKNRHLGAFLPYTPLHYVLFADSPLNAFVMTSGNQSDEPIVKDNGEARERLKDIADYLLLHDRDIYMRCDDSVSRVLHGKPRHLRRARGYVPEPIFLRESVSAVLGVGAELKSTVCLTRGKEAFLSQHIGDLENLETLRSFELTISHLQRILDIAPALIVHDLHPDYLSSLWATRQSLLPCLAVQHHHAHIASVVAERNIARPVIGLALDGTGYGPDGTVWGGEILRVDGDRFERLGHFRRVPLPGGDRAVKEPWRMAVSCLWSLDPQGFEQNYGDVLKRLPREKVGLIVQMLEKRLNAPLTSSCGRLFDAVSSLAGLRDTVSYEGQAAIELEQAIESDSRAYRGTVRKEDGLCVLDPLPMFLEIIRDIRHGASAGVVAARFHNGVANLLVEALRRVSAETGLNRIALSGGVFQNAYLSARLESDLSAQGYEVYSHLNTPSNDACIALGQAYIGAQWLKRKSGLNREEG